LAFIADSTRVLPVQPYLAHFVADAISLDRFFINCSLCFASTNFFSIGASRFDVVEGRTILDLLVISGFIQAFSIGWFTLTFLAHVALPLGAGRSPTGLTSDLPPLLSPTPETPRLTFFRKLEFWISHIDACIILGFVCFENNFIAPRFTVSELASFLHR